MRDTWKNDQQYKTNQVLWSGEPYVYVSSVSLIRYCYPYQDNTSQAIRKNLFDNLIAVWLVEMSMFQSGTCTAADAATDVQ